jgi:hypothetical protein
MNHEAAALTDGLRLSTRLSPVIFREFAVLGEEPTFADVGIATRFAVSQLSDALLPACHAGRQARALSTISNLPRQSCKNAFVNLPLTISIQVNEV